MDQQQFLDIPPAPEFGMSLSQGMPPGSPESPQSDLLGMSGMSSPMGGQMPVTAPVDDPSLAQPGLEDDQILSTLIQNAQRQAPAKPKRKVPKPSVDLIMAIANTQEMRYADRNDRINRDIQLYRQDVSYVPGDFDRKTDTPVISATLPNLVNKLANMLCAPEPRVIIPFDTEQSKIASQAKENFAYWSRKMDRKYYARSGGGNLQWDEFFYLLLHGMIVARILPDPDDERYPFHFSIVDPSTCYPIFKGDKAGLQTMIRRYQSSALDIINTYGRNDPKLEDKMKREMGFDNGSDLREFFEMEGDTIEYWDARYRAVLWRDMVVMDVTEHNYDVGVPFVVSIAKGEPKSMSTPPSQRGGTVDEYGNVGYGPTRSQDLATKAVSVFHHLVQSNRVAEILATLQLMEVEKALNPPTITYVAPMALGDDPGPLNLRKRGNNKRILNYHKVEAVPTSPRPTDSSPLLNKIMSDLSEGGLPPMMHGNESGSNVSGFAVESLIAMAKDATLPYTTAFEVYLAHTIEMKLDHYKQFILPIYTLRVPNNRSYGETPMVELDMQTMDAVANDVEVKLWAMSQQMLPGQIQAATMATQAGIWSLRRAMEHTGSTDPDRDFQDIITERAIQHPSIMENFLIPQSFKAQGNDNLAELWMQSVVLPKMMQGMMGMGMGGQPGGGGPPAEGPNPNGQSNPTMVGRETSTGGGPAAGEGRGPA